MELITDMTGIYGNCMCSSVYNTVADQFAPRLKGGGVVPTVDDGIEKVYETLDALSYEIMERIEQELEK